MTTATIPTSAAQLAAERDARTAERAKDAATAADLAFAQAARSAHLAALFFEPRAAFMAARAAMLLDAALRASELAEYHQRQAALARREAEG
jgi:hypothetical protein